MIDFTPEEQMVVLLYSPGNRLGLITELTAMKQQLTSGEKRLRRLTERVLSKLELISDEDFDSFDFFPDTRE